MSIRYQKDCAAFEYVVRHTFHQASYYARYDVIRLTSTTIVDVFYTRKYSYTETDCSRDLSRHQREKAKTIKTENTKERKTSLWQQLNRQ